MTKILVFIDGLSDSLLPEGTPLETTTHENMNEIASMGSTGTINVFKYPPEPDVAMLSMLGNNPFKYYTGRGVLDAYGFNANFADGDLAIRCEFAKLKDGKLSGPYTTLNINDSKQIEETINKYLSITGVTVYSALDMYGGVLVFKSDRVLSNKITNTNPYFKLEFLKLKMNHKTWEIPLTTFIHPKINEVMKSIPMEDNQSSIFSSNIINKFVETSKVMLEKHPINSKERKADVILTRDGGTKTPNLNKFRENVGAIVDKGFERGIIKLMDGKIIPTPSTSSNLRIDYRNRALLVLSNMYNYDTIIVMLKGPEYYSMLMDKEKKTESIEFLDKYFFGTLLNEINIRENVLFVSSLRTFSSKFGIPTIDPVPFMVAGKGFGPDGIISFDESSVKYGKYRYINSISLKGLLNF